MRVENQLHEVYTQSVSESSKSNVDNKHENKENVKQNCSKGDNNQVTSNDEREKILIIGGSLLRHVREHNMIVDSRIKPVVAFHPGAKIQTVLDHLEHLVDFNDKISVCLIHVGTNNLGRSSTDDMMEQYKDIEKLVHERVPTCVVMYASILPRMDSLQKNLQAIQVNEKLSELCSETENCAFIDSTQTFFKNGEFQRALYGKYDGLHINEAGGAALAENFWRALNGIHFRSTSRRRRCFACGSIAHVRNQCRYADSCFCSLCGRFGHKNVNCHWYSI